MNSSCFDSTHSMSCQTTPCKRKSSCWPLYHVSFSKPLPAIPSLIEEPVKTISLLQIQAQQTIWFYHDRLSVVGILRQPAREQPASPWNLCPHDLWQLGVNSYTFLWSFRNCCRLHGYFFRLCLDYLSNTCVCWSCLQTLINCSLCNRSLKTN